MIARLHISNKSILPGKIVHICPRGYARGKQREAAYLFSDVERTALSWAKEVTRISETHASDEAYPAALFVFGEKDLVELTIVIATMNAINRMGVSYRIKPLAKA